MSSLYGLPSKLLSVIFLSLMLIKNSQGSSCDDTEFTCSKSGECLPKEFLCDGIQHCQDGSGLFEKTKSIFVIFLLDKSK